MTEPVLLRIKLPPSSPVISKTFKVSPNATVHSAVNDVIGKSLQQTISVNSNYGLYLPNQQQWLEDSSLIADVQGAISSEEYVELKDRLGGVPKTKHQDGYELPSALIGFVIGCISTYIAIRILPQ